MITIAVSSQQITFTCEKKLLTNRSLAQKLNKGETYFICCEFLVNIASMY